MLSTALINMRPTPGSAPGTQLSLELSYFFVSLSVRTPTLTNQKPKTYIQVSRYKIWRINDYLPLLEETETEDSDQGLADWANNLPSFRVRDKYVMKMLEDTVTSLGNQTSDTAIACKSISLFFAFM